MACEPTNIYDLCIQQNASFNLIFSLKDDDGSSSIDVTGWSFTGSINDQKGGVDQSIPFFTMSVVSAVSGTIAMRLGAASTWQLTQPRYYYDVIGYNPTVSPPETLRLMQGKVNVNLGVTEP
jgi:hypothetical protein